MDLATIATPAILIVYLGMTNGGFDPTSRSVVGIAAWWTVGVAAAFNVLPAAGGNAASRVIFGLAVAFAGWTALSLAWTDSDERTATELARVASYLGIFTLALAVQGSGRWRELLHGVTLGIVAVCAIAALSRMRPDWFPEQVAGQYLQEIEIERRLAYPLNYPSGLGAFAAIGLPLALAAASSARSTLARALAAGALPLVALTLWLTTSSLSVPAAVIGLAAFLLLAPERIPKLLTLAIAAAGAGILFAATEQREALDRGLPTRTAESEGGELLVLTLAVCGAVALAQFGLSRLVRDAMYPGLLDIPRRAAAIAAGAVAAVALVIAVGAGAPSKASDEWEQFKGKGQETTPGEASRGQEILDFSGSGRYDFWEAAVDANATEPWVGIGPGTWDFWWTQKGSYVAYVRDAHSLFLETLGELGIVGFVLIVGICGGVLGIGSWRALRAPPELRVVLAGATAGCAAFAAGATVDWLWELGVLPAIFFALAAIACAGGALQRQRTSATKPPWQRAAPRVGLVALSIAGLIAIVPPLWGAVKLEDSYEAEAEGRTAAALDDARSAISAQPYAASPRLQEARLLARRGRINAAIKAARASAQREPVNWRRWAAVAILEARAGHPRAAAKAEQRAKRRNPNAPDLVP